jgi:hypothetical protein
VDRRHLRGSVDGASPQGGLDRIFSRRASTSRSSPWTKLWRTCLTVKSPTRRCSGALPISERAPPERWAELLADVSEFVDPLIADTEGELTTWDGGAARWRVDWRALAIDCCRPSQGRRGRNCRSRLCVDWDQCPSVDDGAARSPWRRVPLLQTQCGVV